MSDADDSMPPFTASVYGTPLAAAEAQVERLRDELATLIEKNAGQRAEMERLNDCIKEWMGHDYKNRVRIAGLVATIDAHKQAIVDCRALPELVSADKLRDYDYMQEQIEKRAAEILAAKAGAKAP
jgi:hypothetical protein